MYTKAQDNIDVAIHHQMILVEARHALVSCGESVWDNPQRFSDFFKDNLKRSGTSIEELGLSVLISMTADDYMCRPARITSPVLGLAEAVSMHARLLDARRTSWAHLRSEWIPLMQQTQRCRVKKITLSKVADIVDTAHLKFLERRLRQAVSVSERVLRRWHLIEKKAAKAQAQMLRRAEKAKGYLLGVKKRQREVGRQRTWAVRRAWCKRADLTMKEALH
jgi:hypothetical protein